jgi:hypothetical protein
MDQHQVRRPTRGQAGREFQAVAHGILPLGAPCRMTGDVQPLGGGLEHLTIVGMDDADHLGHGGMGRKGAQGMAQHGLPGKGPVLLGQGAAETMAAPRADDDGRAIRHGFRCRLDQRRKGRVIRRGTY